VAAHDAVLGSNTYALEKLHGWSGICVEAAPPFWLGLAHRSCEVVCAGVGNDREDVTFVFRPEEPGLSGIVGEEFDNKKEEEAVVQQDKVETRRTVTLEEVLRRVGAPNIIDYLSFDVEGAEDLEVRRDAVGALAGVARSRPGGVGDRCACVATIALPTRTVANALPTKDVNPALSSHTIYLHLRQ
jgi:Methyltransferase FkbM domain